MHIPQVTPAATIMPATGLDTTLHELVGISWHVLMPYTVLGAALMTYSQVRLVYGQRALSRQAGKPKKQPTRHVSKA